MGCGADAVPMQRSTGGGARRMEQRRLKLEAGEDQAEVTGRYLAAGEIQTITEAGNSAVVDAATPVKNARANPARRWFS